MKFLQMIRQFRISSILDILWPPEDFWWPTDLDHDDTVTPAQVTSLYGQDPTRSRRHGPGLTMTDHDDSCLNVYVTVPPSN